MQGYAPLGSPGSTAAINNVILKNPILLTVAEKLGKTSAQVALRWGLQMGHSVLPKSTNEARIKENLDVFDWSIPEDLFAKLSEIKQASILFLYMCIHLGLTTSLWVKHGTHLPAIGFYNAWR